MGSASRSASECRLTGDALGANGGTLAEIESLGAARVLPSTMGQEDPRPPPPTETWLEKLTTLRSIKERRCDSEGVLDSLSYHSLAESLLLYLDTFHARLIHDKLKQVNQI